MNEKILPNWRVRINECLFNPTLNRRIPFWLLTYWVGCGRGLFSKSWELEFWILKFNSLRNDQLLSLGNFLGSSLVSKKSHYDNLKMTQIFFWWRFSRRLLLRSSSHYSCSACFLSESYMKHDFQNTRTFCKVLRKKQKSRPVYILMLKKISST